MISDRNVSAFVGRTFRKNCSQLPLSDWDGWYTDDAEEHAPVESVRDWEEGEEGEDANY